MTRIQRLISEIAVLIACASALAYIAGSSSPVTALRSKGAATPATQSTSEYLSIYKSEDAWSGFTLYPVEGGAEVQLLNMRGQIVHRWHVDVERARLLPDGNLLVVHGSKWGKNKKPWNKLRDTIIEYDWNSKPVWRYKASDVLHHDVWRLDNGNTLVLKRELIPDEYRSTIRDSARRASKTRADSIIEIDRDGKKIWKWNAHENLDLNQCGKRGCSYLTGRADAAQKGKDWTHINTAVLIPENRWHDAGDARFRPGNILIMPRNWWTTFIIDRVSGAPVWEYSGDYRGGLGGGHEPHMIPKGLPGAGNILIFDNGSSVHPNESFILEINPVTKEVVWKYESPDFFSPTRGSVQRLPNGNTLISEDTTGRVFEVTPTGEIVWEYRGIKPINRARRYPASFSPKLTSLQLR